MQLPDGGVPVASAQKPIASVFAADTLALPIQICAPSAVGGDTLHVPALYGPK
jgi:hypothetical protein